MGARWLSCGTPIELKIEDLRGPSVRPNSAVSLIDPQWVVSIRIE